ncbi:Ig-like domain repeat protein [Herbaspirillum sp. RV1423]|uniref:Ig-like domain repeat protein n=1 Tax=Herbaspirillum sp. RV1423 TaxID=1443993 RepID=UPI0004B6ACAC|nr:Ig-like domain repeat protein [Herbaspirillum sp. RV1423]
MNNSKKNLRAHGEKQAGGLLTRTIRAAICKGVLALIAWCCTLSMAQAGATTALADGTVGVSYNQTFVIPSNGMCPQLTFVYSNWINGLTLNPASTDPNFCTYYVAGTPTQAGTASLTVTLSDTNGVPIDTFFYTITVAPYVATSVTLSSSSGSVGFGTAVTLTAHLAGSIAGSGNVTFMDGASTLGTATISGGNASLITSALTAGVHSITAVFSGDSTTSTPVTVSVAQATPSIALSASSTSITYGSTVTLTAALTGGAGISGTVTFKDGATTLGSGTLSGAAASFSISSLGVGTHTITAVYGGDANYASATSSLLTVVVAQAAPSVALSASSTSTTYGNTVTLTAALTGGAGISGTVTFKDGATTLGSSTVSGAVASFATSSLAAGTHTITAVYGGDANYASITSSLLTVTIAQATPAVMLSTSATSAAYGAAITLTANVSGTGSPSGTVTFKDGGTTLGTGVISGGAAILSVSTLTVGPHSITAVYGGDANYAAATSSAVSVAMTQVTPGIAVTVSSASVSVGSAVTISATLTGAASPGGTVTFKNGTATLGTASISGVTAILTTSSLTVGPHSITAVYGGDANNIAVTSGAVSVSVVQMTPTVALGLSAASAPYGTALILTATFSGGSAPGGTVVFKDGASTLGSAGVSGTTATLSIATLAVGLHTLTAEYGGDANNTTAVSAAALVTIAKVAPTIVASASATSVSERAPVILTATLSGGSAPTGTVSFKDGSTVIGSGTVSGTTATYTTSTLSVGVHSITAAYGGDTNNDAMTSGAFTLTVASTSPAIASLSPAGGPALGGTRVVISGANLGGASAVSFGGVAAKIVANAVNAITVTTPAHAAGAIDVVITTANGTVTGSGVFVYAALPDPTKNAAVTALMAAQTQAVQRFSSAQLNNFNQRLETLHGDGWARSSFGLSVNPAATSGSTDNFWAVNGDTVNYAGTGLEALRRGLRRTSPAAQSTATPTHAEDEGLPDLPQSPGAASRQEMSWWIGGALDLGQQKSNGVQSGFKLTTSGISFGGDYRVGSKLTLGLGAGYSRSNYTADDASARSVGQAVMMVAYASVRPAPQVYVDVVAGYGALHFDLMRYVSDAGVNASGSRGGRQLFGSLTAGYEWRGDNWMLSPFGRVDIARARLDRYTESGNGAGALTYFGQTVRNDAASLGMRGELSYHLAVGTLVPQARIAYQHSLQGAGQAAMTYADPTLSSPIYTVADTSQDNSQWLGGLGLKLLLKNGIALSLMYSHSIANSQTSTQSVNVNVTGKF